MRRLTVSPLRFLLILLAPAAMAVLGYLFLIPAPRSALGAGAVWIWVVDPVPASTAETMMDRGGLPAIRALKSRGAWCRLGSRGVHSFHGAWFELFTGKDATRLTGIGMKPDPVTGRAIPPNLRDSCRNAVLWRILKWHHKPVRWITTPNPAPGDPGATRIIHLPRNARPPADYLNAVDTSLAGMLRDAPIPPQIIMISPLGIAPADRVFHINDWLADRSVLAWSGNRIDPKRTRAYCLDDADDGIRFIHGSVSGGGPAGGGKDDGWRRDLVNALKTFSGADDASPVFRKVLAGARVFRNAEPGEYPDIRLIRNDPRLVLDCSHSPEIAASRRFLERGGDATCLTADSGWMILNGSAFLPGIHRDDYLAIDVTPTVLTLLDLPVGADMTGRVLRTAMTPPWQEKQKRIVPSHEREDFRVRQPPRVRRTAPGGSMDK